MPTPKLKTVYDAMQPLDYFNCYIGMGVFRRPNRSCTQYFIMQLYTVIITIVHWTTIYITFTSALPALDLDSISPMALIMYKVLVCANSTIAMLAPFLGLFRRKVLGDCMGQMPILDETFRAVLGARNEYEKEYIRMIYKIIVIMCVFIFVGICDSISSMNFELLEMDVQSLSIFCCYGHAIHHPIIVMLLLDVNFCTFLRYLGKKFRDLNDSLLRLVDDQPLNSSPDKALFIISQEVRKRPFENRVRNVEPGRYLITDKHSLLRENRKAHFELTELSQKINQAFGVQNLLSTGQSFIMITGLLYNIYYTFVSDDLPISKLKLVTPPVLWTAIYVSKVLMVNHSCSSVSSEAKRTGEVMYELLNSKIDNELQKEIQEFGVQILHNPVQFNACGFFILDYSFVQGVIGSITTYLVILIQMSYRSVNLTPSSAPIVNDTQVSVN